MPINQLHDDGAVIGYRPKLQYIKEKVQGTAEEVLSSAESHSDIVQRTNTVNNFSNNLPSAALDSIEYTTNNIDFLIKKLASAFQKDNWNQYGEISSLLSAVENNDTNYISNFIDYHKNNITGSIVPELIGLLYDTSKRLETLSSTLKLLYYGDSNIGTQEAEQIDAAYLKKIQSYEDNDEAAKVNYLALSYDSVLNKAVSTYALFVNQKCIDIANVVNQSDDSSATQSRAALIQKLFGDINEEINYRKETFDTQQSIEIMQQTLYNYYSKRQESIELYDLFNENYGSVYIGSKIQSYKQTLDDTIVNINRTFVGNQHYLSEMAKMEREKNFLMNIYATFNYNSNN